MGAAFSSQLRLFLYQRSTAACVMRAGCEYVGILGDAAPSIPTYSRPGDVCAGNTGMTVCGATRRHIVACCSQSTSPSSGVQCVVSSCIMFEGGAGWLGGRGVGVGVGVSSSYVATVALCSQATDINGSPCRRHYRCMTTVSMCSTQQCQ